MKFKTITLDWDINYDDVKQSVSYSVLEKWVQEHGNVKRVWMRRSAFGNTHVKIELKKPVTEYELMKVRAYLRDDVYRLKMDLMRAYRKMRVNRLWDSKVEDGKLKKAGEWVKVRQNINKSGR